MSTHGTGKPCSYAGCTSACPVGLRYCRFHADAIWRAMGKSRYLTSRPSDHRPRGSGARENRTDTREGD
jgi:hypothetical protein